MIRRQAPALIAAALGLLATQAAAKTLAPARVELTVRWAGDGGSDTFREEMQRVAAESLATTCFTSVTIVEDSATPSDADLTLGIVLSGEVEETRFDDAIATVLQPGEPAKELRHTSRCAVNVDAALSVKRTGALVRGKHFGIDMRRQPVYPGEDVQASARAGAVDAAVRELGRAIGCGSSKLVKTVHDALAASAPTAPPSR